MNQVEDRQVHQLLRQSATGFAYPPTPDLRPAVHERLRQPPRWRALRLQPVGALLALLLAAALLLLVPQVRAAMIEVLRAGGITIFVGEPTLETQTPGSLPATATTVSDSSPPALLVPATPTSFEAAQEALGQASALPSYSTELGAPDQLYVDDEREAQVVIALWLEEGKPSYTLYMIATAQFAFKGADTVISTSVDGAEAFWVDGLHGFSLQEPGMWNGPVTSGSVLIWWRDDLTYRLEGAETLEEAQRIAASLR